MYTLNHDGEKVGATNLERGDPSNRAVSGVFNNLGGAKAIAAWIKSIGGQEDDGVVFIVLDEAFSLLDKDGNVIQFQEGHLMAVPQSDEVFLDITGLSEEDYKGYFSGHISAMGD